MTAKGAAVVTRAAADELVRKLAHPISAAGAEAARQHNRTLLSDALASAYQSGRDYAERGGWAVRALDAWAAKHKSIGASWDNKARAGGDNPSPRCTVRGLEGRYFYGSTPDAARIAAAEALYAEDNTLPPPPPKPTEGGG